MWQSNIFGFGQFLINVTIGTTISFYLTMVECLKNWPRVSFCQIPENVALDFNS